MVRYTAKDLVKAARQIADLENSDFISWNENIRMMNEAYTGLYQKLINKGDESFLVSFRTTDKEIELPNDFWQLKNVSIWNNGNIMPVLRRSASTNYNSLYYELRNNVLYITGTFNGEILVEYWPAPVALYYPPEPKNLGVECPASPMDAYDKTLIIIDNPAPKWATVNIDTGDKITYDVRIENYGSAKLFKNYFVLSTFQDNENPYTKYTIRNYNGAVIAQDSESPSNLVLVGDSIYKNNNENKLEKIFGSVNDDDIIDVDLSEYTSKPYTYFIYYLPNGTVMEYGLYDNITSYTQIIINGKSFMCNLPPKVCGNTIYWCQRDYNRALEYDTDTDKIVEIKLSKVPVTVSKIDDNTGFGIYTREGDNLHIEPFLEDTCLDFPNSFYFEILSYILAAAYKAKQGADDSQILSKLSQLEQVFYDTLSSDAYGPIRITNVY